MVFYSGARMEWPVYMIIYISFVGYLIKARMNKTGYSVKPYRIFNYIFVATIIFILVAIQFFDFDKYAEYIHSTADSDMLLERIFHARQIYVFDILYYMREQPFIRRLLGGDITQIYLHTVKFDRSHSEYLQTFYSLGYIGVALMTGFWVTIVDTVSKIKEKKLRRTTTLLLIFFLITGLVIEVFESTQMSWFVLLFAGIAVTEESKQNLNENIE